MNEKVTISDPLYLVQVHLSQNAGRIILGCAETLRLNANKDGITYKTLLMVRDEIEDGFNFKPRDDNKEVKASVVFRLTRIAYDLVVNIVRLAKETEPDSPDNGLRDTVLKTLQDAYPTQRDAAKQPSGDVGDGDSIGASPDDSIGPRTTV